MINCILVDDEPLALRLLESYVARTPDLRLAGAFSSAEEARECINGEAIDLAFLDIQMPGMNGIELARAAREHNVRVVFVTAYRDFALDGFRVAALDYLLKPVSFEEFSDAVERFRYVRRSMGQTPETGPEASIMVKSDYRNVPVRFSDILYVEGLKDYIKIYIAGRERPIVTQMSLKAIESELPAPAFMRVHRSFIVALDKVGAFTRSQLTMGSASIPIGDTYRARVMETLQG